MNTSKTVCGKCKKEFDGLMTYLPAHEPCIKGLSIADKASKIVETWSESKRSAFEQRTDLTLKVKE